MAARWSPQNHRASFTTSGTSGPRTTSPAGASCDQKVMGEGDAEFYGKPRCTSYSTLVSQVRRQFELMVPEMFRKVRKLEDGDEIDIDDVIEAFVDIRTGAVGPSDKLYWRRNKVQRDVAVAFLLDTSASTAEAIDDVAEGVGRLERAGRPGGVHGLAEDEARRGDASLVQADHRPGERGDRPADRRSGGHRRRLRYLRASPATAVRT